MGEAGGSFGSRRNSVDQHGLRWDEGRIRSGIDQCHCRSVSIPVIASGGAGSLEHFYDALTVGGADAALAASLFHYKELEIQEVKNYLAQRNVPVRR